MSFEKLSSLITNAATDLVGVYDKNFDQVFSSARPIKVTVKEDAKVMEHPLETGATITDHRIILPIEIEISLILQASDYRNTYEKIKQIYLNGTLLLVQTKTDVYDNQIISGMPHEEDPELYDAITVALKLKEAQFAVPKFGVVPRSPKDSSTIGRGNQQSKDVGTNQSSVQRWRKS